MKLLALVALLGLAGCEQRTCATFAPLSAVQPIANAGIPPAPAAYVPKGDTVSSRLVNELDFDPGGWSGDEYWLRYRDGTAIWIANADYGLSVHPASGGVLWGLGEDGANKANQRAVYEATQRWAKRRILGAGIKP